MMVPLLKRLEYMSKNQLIYDTLSAYIIKLKQTFSILITLIATYYNIRTAEKHPYSKYIFITKYIIFINNINI